MADSNVPNVGQHNPQATYNQLPGNGEINTASNLGVGIGLFSQKIGVDLQFRSLIGGEGITVSQVGNDLEINTNQPIMRSGVTGLLAVGESYSVVFSLEMSSANYAASASSVDHTGNSYSGTVHSRTTLGFTITNNTGYSVTFGWMAIEPV